MKKEVKNINVDSDIIKKIKKNKKVIYVIPKTLDYEIKTKVMLVNEMVDQRILRTVKHIYNEEELANPKVTKYLLPHDVEISNMVGIEFKKKKRVIQKLLLSIVVFILVLIGYLFIDNKISTIRDQKLQERIATITQDAISYVVIEINPKVILEIINGKIVNQGCLNKDCQYLFQNVNVQNKSLNDAIDLFYNVAKDNGVDVSNGVKVSSTESSVKKTVETIEYANYVQITNKEEQEAISQVIDNEQIKKQESKQNKNDNLLEVLKQDSDYGKLYTCKMQDEELGCYIVAEHTIPEYYEKEADIIANLPKMLVKMKNLNKIIKKFNIVTNFSLTDTFKIYINGNEYQFGNRSFGISQANSDGLWIEKDRLVFKNVFYLDPPEPEVGEKITEEMETVTIIDAKDLNLLNPTSSKNFKVVPYYDEINQISGYRVK